jgi:hypothetical protein
MTSTMNEKVLSIGDVVNGHVLTETGWLPVRTREESAPKKDGKAVKITAMVVGGILALGLIGAVSGGDEPTAATAPSVASAPVAPAPAPVDADAEAKAEIDSVLREAVADKPTAETADALIAFGGRMIARGERIVAAARNLSDPALSAIMVEAGEAVIYTGEGFQNLDPAQAKEGLARMEALSARMKAEGGTGI